MADDANRRRRIVRADAPQRRPRLIRHSIQLPRRTSGLLAYYAQTRGLDISHVIAQSLSVTLAGMRISDPGADEGEGEGDG